MEQFEATFFAKCKLDDGSVRQYDAADPKPDAYDPEKFKLIGRGVICEWAGIPQQFTEKLYFFVRRTA